MEKIYFPSSQQSTRERREVLLSLLGIWAPLQSSNRCFFCLSFPCLSQNVASPVRGVRKLLSPARWSSVTMRNASASPCPSPDSVSGRLATQAAKESCHLQTAGVIPPWVPFGLAVNLSRPGGHWKYLCFMSRTNITGVCMTTIGAHESISNFSRPVQHWLIQVEVVNFHKETATPFRSSLGPLWLSQYLGSLRESFTQTFWIMLSLAAEPLPACKSALAFQEGKCYRLKIL